MRKKVVCVMLGAALMAVNPMYGFASETELAQEVFTEQDASAADGYYSVDGETLLIMNGIAYDISAESGKAARIQDELQVYVSGNNFILISDGDAIAFRCQEEKGETAKGGMYYAMYSDYKGTASEVEFTEGKDIQIGEYIFGHDYYVTERDPLATFFQIGQDQGNENGVTAQTTTEQNKIEGSGFETPEEAVIWYVEELKSMDIDKMISAYAVESWEDHYQMSKELEVRKQYYGCALPWIDQKNTYARALNLENRRSTILEEITHQYLSLIGSDFYTEKYGLIDLYSTDETVDELLDRVFPEVEDGFLQNITVQNFTTQEDINGLCGEESVQGYVEYYREICGAEDFRPIAARLQVDGEDWLISFDAIEYDGRWYLFQAHGIIGTYLQMDEARRGVESFEDIEKETETEEWESESETED